LVIFRLQESLHLSNMSVAAQIPAVDKPKKPLPFAYQFAAGAIAGVTELLCLYPLDVVKTRIQLQTKTSGTNYTGMVDCFKQIIAQEGFGRLYRGLVPPLMLEAPKRAVKFSANGFWGTTYKDLFNVPQMTQSISILTGCSAGATEAVVVVPFELVKIRLQDKASTYKGPIDVVKRIVAADGILGMYAGLESTMWRHIMWNGGYFGCIFQVKALLPKSTTSSGELLNNFVSGSIGGFVGTVLNTPFDVIKSRVQNSPKVPGQLPKYNWTLPSLAIVAREEGFGALYKGFVPKVLRLAPGGGVLLLVVEVVGNFFRTKLFLLDFFAPDSFGSHKDTFAIVRFRFAITPDVASKLPQRLLVNSAYHNFGLTLEDTFDTVWYLFEYRQWKPKLQVENPARIQRSPITHSLERDEQLVAHRDASHCIEQQRACKTPVFPLDLQLRLVDLNNNLLATLACLRASERYKGWHRQLNLALWTSNDGRLLVNRRTADDIHFWRKRDAGAANMRVSLQRVARATTAEQ